MGNWIKIHSKMTEWRWYRDGYTTRIFLHLLLTANYKDKPFLNTTVKRGQVLTSIRHLSEDLDIPEKTVRRKLENLKSTGEVVTESTNRWTIITICNYESYQSPRKTDDQTDDQTDDRTDDQTDDQQLKNNRIIDNIPPLSKERVSPLKGGTPLEDRQKSFYDSLIPFVAKYGREMIRDFYNYWSEPDRAAKPKMRFEKEKTWSLERRLETWNRNEARFNSRTMKSKGEKMWDNIKKNLAVLPFNEDGTVNI